MAGPVGADGGAEGLPFTGDTEFEWACWLKAKPPTTAGEPPEAFTDGEDCCPFVAFAYEERALDVVPEAADGEADFVGALMGVMEDWTVLDIRCLSMAVAANFFWWFLKCEAN
jgi:hypothetical protein